MVKTFILPFVFLVSALSAFGQPHFTNVVVGTQNAGGGDVPYIALSKINYALNSISNNIATNSAVTVGHKLDITNGTASGTLTASNILGNVAGVINGKAPPFSMAGDDSTDDSTAIGTAKTRADALGQDIFLPSGTYIVGGLTWDADVAIHGVPGETILKLKAGSTNMFNFTAPQSRRWSGITFDGNSDNQSTNKSATIIHGYGAGQIFDRCSFINVENIAYNDFRMTTGVKFFDLYVSNVTCLATNAEYVNTVITIAPGIANTFPEVVFDRYVFTNAPASDSTRQPGAFYVAGDDAVASLIRFTAQNGRVHNFGGNSAATGGASHYGTAVYDMYEDVIPTIRNSYDEGADYITFKIQNSSFSVLEGNVTTNSSASSVYHISPGERGQSNGFHRMFTIRDNKVLDSTNSVAILIDGVLSPVYGHTVAGNTLSNVLQGIRANGSSYSDGKGIKGPGYYGDNKIYSTGHNSFWFLGTDGRFILDNNDATVTGEASAFSAVSGNTNSTFQIIGGNYHAASGTAFNVKGVKALVGSGVRYSGTTSISLSQSSDGALVQRFKWDASNTEVSGTASITWADISDGLYEDFTSAGVLVRRLFPSGGIEIGYKDDTEYYRLDTATIGNYTMYVPKDVAGIANGIRLLNNTDTGGIRYAAGSESALGYFGTWDDNFATVGQQDKTGIEADSSASAIVFYAPGASQTIDFYSGSTTRAMQLNGANLSVTGSATANSFIGSGSSLTIDASGFNGNLTTSDNTLQEVAQKLDDLSAAGGDAFPLSEDADANGHSITNFGTLSGETLEVDELVVANAGAGIIGKTNVTDGRLLMGNGTNALVEMIIGSGLTSSTNAGSGTHTLTVDGIETPNSVHVKGIEVENANLIDSATITIDTTSTTNVSFTVSDDLATDDEVTAAIAAIDSSSLYDYSSFVETYGNTAVTVYTNDAISTSDTTIHLSADVTGAGATNAYSFDIRCHGWNSGGSVTLYTNQLVTMPSGTNLLAYWEVASSTIVLKVRGFENETNRWNINVKQRNFVTNGLATSAGGATYLVKQDFEGTGYDNGESWTETGSPNEDSETSPLVGSQSFRVAATASATWARSPSFTDQSTLHCYFQFRPDDNTGGARRFFFIRNSSDVDLVMVQQNADRTILVRAGTAGGSTTVGTVTLDTIYHFWVTYTKGTGANATATVAFSTDGTKPTSGDNYQIHSTGNATTDADYIGLGNSAAQVIPTWDLDKVRVDDEVIGDNPE
jgi:hypothetical protein